MGVKVLYFLVFIIVVISILFVKNILNKYEAHRDSRILKLGVIKVFFVKGKKGEIRSFSFYFQILNYIIMLFLIFVCIYETMLFNDGENPLFFPGVLIIAIAYLFLLIVVAAVLGFKLAAISEKKSG